MDTDDRIIGHVVGDPGERVGAYQFPALGVSGAIVKVPEKTQGEYITIQWRPPAGADIVLFYGFFATEALAAAGFDLTTVTASPPGGSDSGLIATAPLWIERGKEDVSIPTGNYFLRLQAESGTGRAAIATSDRSLNIKDPL